jgi:ORF6N domain
MAKTGKELMIPDDLVMNKIYLICGQKVMLDRDLAELYAVTTGNLNLAVKGTRTGFLTILCFNLQNKSFKV